MYKLSESVEKSKIESTWTKLWLFEGGGRLTPCPGGQAKSIGSTLVNILYRLCRGFVKKQIEIAGMNYQ